ncbi:hypothetical protein, partial [Vibrio alginolyticus]|uniref:hypothetical protein n=1 Tax=Vibrio alginolyticus TaxID=663 RepID=UPI001A8FB998
SSQTYRESAAQTHRHDLHFDTSGDVECVPRPYFTAAELLGVEETRAHTIQCHWRGYLARKRAKKIRADLVAQRAAAA